MKDFLTTTFFTYGWKISKNGKVHPEIEDIEIKVTPGKILSKLYLILFELNSIKVSHEKKNSKFRKEAFEREPSTSEREERSRKKIAFPCEKGLTLTEVCVH